MKELIVKPSFSSKITVNSEYLEKQLLELSIKGGYHYELFEYALNQYRLRPWLYDIYGENREKYLDNIIGYIKDEIIENQGYSLRDIFNEYRLLDSISSKEANIELVHKLSNDMIYKFTKHLLCNVIEGENGEPTIKSMLNWLN